MTKSGVQVPPVLPSITGTVFYDEAEKSVNEAVGVGQCGSDTYLVCPVSPHT